MHDANRIKLSARLAEINRLIEACNAVDADPGDIDPVLALADYTRLIRDLANRRMLDLTYGDNRRA